MSAYRFPNRAMIEIVAPCAKLAEEPEMGLFAALEPLPALGELDGDEPAAAERRRHGRRTRPGRAADSAGRPGEWDAAGRGPLQSGLPGGLLRRAAARS